jgi:hypothetical protein
MGKTRMLVLSIVVAAGAVAVPYASSGDEKRVVLTERMQLTGFDPATGAGTQAGSFVAAGAINDAGAATATFTLVPAGGGCGRLAGTHVFTGSSGTISVHTEALACPFPPISPPRSFVRGRWRVVGGTGAYAGLAGRGRIVATGDFATGVITIARDGKVNG